jgi:hypothetical protein
LALGKRSLACLFLSVWIVVPVTSASDDRPTAGGRLMWDSGEELDLIADLWADLPRNLGNGDSIFFSLQMRTAIEKAQSDFTFALRDLDYSLELGWRRPFAGLRSSRLSLFAGQREKILIDAEGSAFIRYLGAGLESPGFRSYRPGEWERTAWRLAAAPILQDHGIDADLLIRGEGRFRPWPAASRLASAVALEFKFDGLLGNGEFDADISGGPGLVLPLASGNTMKFFAHYQTSRHPLGIGHSALLAGYEYSGRAGTGGGSRQPPEIGGLIAAGAGGEERQAARFRLGVRTPPLAGELRIAFVVDANLLTAIDTNELYYFYHLGLERPLGRNITGIYYYHRSNHQLDRPNDRITSINVIEAGIETDGWHDWGNRRLLGAWGRLDGRARFGYLLDSSFGEERRWHVRGGCRWIMPVAAGRFRPFIALEAEAGDIERQSYALGTALGSALSAQVEFRSDEQYFGRDRTALLLLVSYSF